MEHLRKILSGGVQAPPADIYIPYIHIYTYIYAYIHITDPYRREMQRRIRWDGLFDLTRP